MYNDNTNDNYDHHDANNITQYSESNIYRWLSIYTFIYMRVSVSCYNCSSPMDTWLSTADVVVGVLGDNELTLAASHCSV